MKPNAAEAKEITGFETASLVCSRVLSAGEEGICSIPLLLDTEEEEAVGGTGASEPLLGEVVKASGLVVGDGTVALELVECVETAPVEGVGETISV